MDIMGKLRRVRISLTAPPAVLDATGSNWSDGTLMTPPTVTHFGLAILHSDRQTESKLLFRFDDGQEDNANG